jgi:predicted nucleic acid-binding protein
MGLMADLGSGPIALDTSIFIYLIEEHPDYLPLLTPVFSAVASGKLEIATSAVTLLEVLIIPYRARDLSLANRYEALLTRSRGLHLVDIDRFQLRAAAQIRAHYRVRTPDALQLAAALSKRCSALLTNDRAIPELPGLKILQLRDYLPKRGRDRS